MNLKFNNKRSTEKIFITMKINENQTNHTKSVAQYLRKTSHLRDLFY